MRGFLLTSGMATLVLAVLLLQPSRVLSEAYYAQDKASGGCFANITSTAENLDFFTLRVGAPYRVIIYPQSFALERWGGADVNVAIRGAETSDTYYNERLSAGSGGVLSVDLNSSIEEDVHIDFTMGETECRRVFTYRKEQKLVFRSLHIT